MAVDSRDRVSVDLHGLGPTVKAEAAPRSLTLAAFPRAAIVESLQRNGLNAPVPTPGSVDRSLVS